MKNSISKSVLAILALGIAIIVLVIWLGHRPPAPTTAPVQPVAESTTPPPAAATVAQKTAVAPAVVQDNGELPPVIPIPLTNVLIDPENSTWLKDKDYLRAPHQPQTFGSVDFLMDGMLQLQGQVSRDYRNRHYRTNIFLPLALTNVTDKGKDVIQRGSGIGSVYLLGGSRYGTTGTFAEIVWHYMDGTSLRTPIECGVHFRDWVRPPYEDPAHLPYAFTKVVWTTPQPSRPGSNLRLYRTAFANPAPDKVISTLEFASAMQDPTLFIVGVTLDPLKPGERPDISPDLEPTDPFPPKRIMIFVQSPDGKPLPQASVKTQSEQQSGKSTIRSNNSKTTDANGSAIVNYPPENLNRLEVDASDEDYGARKMVWDVKGGDTIPDSYTLKLTAAITIGGIVVDSSDNPLPGTQISTYRFWTGNDDNPSKPGDHADFPSQNLTTDAAGQWQAKGLPEELLNRIGFNVTHTDYIATNVTVGQDSDVEKQLRAGTFKITLQQGLDVSGRVLDDSDNPISGAAVWVGQKYYRDRQQTKTDDDGKFAFHNVSTGDTVFSASATNRASDSKTFTVSTNMPEIVFRLGPGKSIRGTVVDDNGSPIQGVQVTLEGNGDIGRTYEFSANTDASGRFEWDSAPSDPMQFYFGKEGYESKRNVTLPPDQDNTITLHDPRQVQGQVMDADSGQPVTQFTILTGHRQDATSDNIYGAINYKNFKSADGTFTLSLDEEDDDAVQVTSDNYSKTTQSLPDAQNGIIQVTIKMKYSPAIQGVVLQPDGTPAAGASVAATSPEMGNGPVQLQGTRFSSWGSTKVVIADANGQFTLPSPDPNGTVVAVGEAGFVSVPANEVRTTPTITLQPFGRVVGTLNIGGQPGAGKQLGFNLSIPGLSADFNSYKATTDDQGNFTFENLPPGNASISQIIPTFANSWTYTDNTSVTINPGQTTQVTLGGNGATITGTVRLEVPPTNGESIVFQGNVSGQAPQTPDFSSQAEAQAYYQSAEWQAISQKIKRYAFAVNPDGSFSVNDVAPGTYSVSVNAFQNTAQPWSHQFGFGNSSFTVPDSFDPSTPISIGEIVINPPSPPVPPSSNN